MAERIRVKQIKSGIGRTARDNETLKALGLRKHQSVVEKDKKPEIMGMVDRVKHLVTVEDI